MNWDCSPQAEQARREAEVLAFAEQCADSILIQQARGQWLLDQALCGTEWLLEINDGEVA